MLTWGQQANGVKEFVEYQVEGLTIITMEAPLV